MKTREEFMLLADAYRKEILWRSMLQLPALVVVGIFCLMPAGLVYRLAGLQVISDETDAKLLLIGIWIALFFPAMICWNLYQLNSRKSLARKFELACPSCSRVIGASDLKLAIATHHCPSCGSNFFS